MLETEWKFFKQHEREFSSKYDGKVIVIVGEEVVGEYATELEAYEQAKKSYQMGTFLIQRCSASNQTSHQTFHSRIIYKDQPATL